MARWNAASHCAAQRAVDGTVVHRQRAGHYRAHLEFAVSTTGFCCDAPTARMGGRGGVDDGREPAHAMHSQVAHAERAALVLLRAQLACPRPRGQVGDLGADLRQGLAVGSAHDGRDQPGVGGHGHGHVGLRVLAHGGIGPTDIGLRHFTQGHGHGAH